MQSYADAASLTFEQRTVTMAAGRSQSTKNAQNAKFREHLMVRHPRGSRTGSPSETRSAALDGAYARYITSIPYLGPEPPRDYAWSTPVLAERHPASEYPIACP